MLNQCNWKVGGAAGEGIKTTGLIFSKTCIRHGFHTFDYTEYPSLIRGGHNTYQVVYSPEKVYSPENQVDLLLALNPHALEYHLSEMSPTGAIVIDAKDHHLDLTQIQTSVKLLDVPLVELAKSVGGERVMANNVALGASVFLLSLDIKHLDSVIQATFQDKNQSVIDLNLQAARAGYNYAKDHFEALSEFQFTPKAVVEDLTISGNEALALGAVAGGLKAYIAYPMTPSSTILHQLADWQEKANIFVKHAEDEIGVINMALGMSFAGVRTAVGTSGGGFCYMTEAVGLAGVAELPLVIYEAQRPGPALGMPTWTAQGDLLFSIYASQDEFPRIVLAPGDVYEAFNLSKDAFTLAEKYQIPVIVLSDKHLSESNESFHLDTLVFNHQQISHQPQPVCDQTGFYPRYQTNGGPLSLRSFPGDPQGIYLANSYEHDIYGLGSETASDRRQQMEKRMTKLDLIRENDLPQPYYYGDPHPQITFVSFGSTKGAVRAAIDQLNRSNLPAAMLHLSWLWPFPTQAVKTILEAATCPIVVEGNYTHQLATLIRQETGIDIYHKRTKYDGRPFYPAEIVGFAQEIVGKTG